MAETTTAPATGQNDNMIIIILCWIFAPIVGLFFMSNTDADVKWHAKQTLYFGVLDIVINILFFILTTVLTLTFILAPIAACLGIFWFVWGILAIVVRIYGAVQASQGTKWEIPVLSKYVK
jgi:uncharacterized membrane protein